MSVIAAEIDNIEYDADALECIIEHENNFKTRIFELILENRGNQHGGVFHTGDEVIIDLEGTENFRGHVENVYTEDVAGWVDRMVIKLTGKGYGKNLANLYISKDYPTAAITKTDDILDDSLDVAQAGMDAGDKLTYVSDSEAPVGEYKARRTYLQKMWRELGERIDWDGYTDKTKIVHFFAIGAVTAHYPVNLIEGVNVLHLNEGEEIGDQIKNYVEFYAGEVKNHWSNENAADWTPGTNCTVTNEYTLKLPGSTSSLKLTRSNAGAHFMELAFPEYNYTSIDLSEGHECQVWVLHDEAVWHSANIRPRLKDGDGNIIEWLKEPIRYADPGATELIPEDGFFHQIRFPVGENLEVKAALKNGHWWLQTDVDGSFNWSDVVSIGFNVVLIAGDCNIYFDYLHIPGIEVISIAESVASQTSYLIRKWRDYRPNVMSQLELDADLDSYVLKHKNPLETVVCWAQGQKTVLYASLSLDVQAPNKGIADLTKYRIKRLKHHAKVGGIPGFPGEDYITYFELIKHTIGEASQPLSSRRYDMSERPGIETIRALRDFVDAMGESSMPIAGHTYTRIPDDFEYTNVQYGLFANIPAVGDDGWMYWATDRDIWYGWNIIDADDDWDELTRAEARIRLAQLAGKDHTDLDTVTSGQHHAKSHAARHPTIGGADPLDTGSDGSHTHTINYTTGYVYQTYAQRYAHESNDPESALWGFYAPTSQTQKNIGHTTISSSGAHDHNVTTSPSTDREDAKEGEEMIVFIDDTFLEDGRRQVKVYYPEFEISRRVTHPIGSTDDRVIKDAKHHYHMLWDLKNEGKLLSEPKPGPLKGKPIKWDKDAEKLYMDAQLADDGEGERRANETGKKMKALFDGE